MRGLGGSLGAWVAWVKFLRGFRGSNIFLRGPIFFAWVFAWVKVFYLGPKFLRGSIFFCMGQLLFTRRDFFYYTTTNSLENFSNLD